MSADFYEETICGLKLTITDSVRGPKPWVEGIQAPLAWFVILVLDGHIPDALEKIELGEDTGDGAAVSAVRPNKFHMGSAGFAKLQNQWRTLTGTEPGDDVYITGASFLEDSFLVPRKALKEILLRYLALRKNPPKRS